MYNPHYTRRIRNSRGTLTRCAALLDITEERVQHSNETLQRSVDRLQQSDERRRDRVGLERSPDLADAATPAAFKCPQCGQKLAFHNARCELNANKRPEGVTVYLCINHGFYRFSKSTGLTSGM